jgi:hypothetical protein
MNTPHTHPRATEFNFAVNGTFKGGFLAENGARFVMHDIPPGSAAVFPQGEFAQRFASRTAVHHLWQAPFTLNSTTHVVRKRDSALCYNVSTCAEDMIFVAAFNHEDPGVLQVAQRCKLATPYLFFYFKKTKSFF